MRLRQGALAVAAADEALKIAEPLSMIAIMAEALVNKGAAMSGDGRWREGSALVDLGARLAADADATALHLRALNNLASTIQEDDPARAVRVAAEALEVAHRLGIRGMVNWLTGTLAIARLSTGSDWEETLEILKSATEDAGNDSDRLRLTMMRVAIEDNQGDFDDALLERAFELLKAVDDPGFTGLGETTLGDRALALGDGAAAYEHFTAALVADALDLWSIAGKMRSAIWMGDPKLIRDAWAVLDAFPGSGRTTVAAKHWGHAAVAAIDGRRAEAVSEFRRAIELMNETESYFEAARLALDAMKMLPDEPQVRSLADAARAAFEVAGAKPYLKFVDQALAAGGNVETGSRVVSSAETAEAVAQKG